MLLREIVHLILIRESYASVLPSHGAILTIVLTSIPEDRSLIHLFALALCFSGHPAIVGTDMRPIFWTWSRARRADYKVRTST
jgi:hypothetical protein